MLENELCLHPVYNLHHPVPTTVYINAHYVSNIYLAYYLNNYPKFCHRHDQDKDIYMSRIALSSKSHSGELLRVGREEFIEATCDDTVGFVLMSAATVGFD